MDGTVQMRVCRQYIITDINWKVGIWYMWNMVYVL